jgi:hypothetical protein
MEFCIAELINIVFVVFILCFVPKFSLNHMSGLTTFSSRDFDNHLILFALTANKEPSH